MYVEVEEERACWLMISVAVVDEEITPKPETPKDGAC